jgi:hypothetical protein
MHFAVYVTAYSDLGQPVTRWLVGGITASSYHDGECMASGIFPRRPYERLELVHVVDVRGKLWVDRNEMMKCDRDAAFEFFMDEVIMKGVPAYGI